MKVKLWEEQPDIMDVDEHEKVFDNECEADQIGSLSERDISVLKRKKVFGNHRANDVGKSG